MARAILVAGANGAGKTTFARQFLPTLYPGAVFLNADEIQRRVAVDEWYRWKSDDGGLRLVQHHER